MGIYVKSGGVLAPAATSKGLQGLQGIQGIKGDKGDPGGWVASGLAPANLNTATTAGLYLMTFTAASAAGSNAPIALEGHVEVIKYGTTYVLQRYSVANVNNNYTYTRTSADNGATWTVWALIGSKPVSDHVAAADPHTQYAKKAGDTFTGAHIFTGTLSQEVGTGLDAEISAKAQDATRASSFTMWRGGARKALVGVSGATGDDKFRIYHYGRGKALMEQVSGTSDDLVFAGAIRTHGASGPSFLSGTGSPDGVVAANPGSRFIDTNATNGIVEWVKVSSLGPGGWKPVVLQPSAGTGWADNTLAKPMYSNIQSASTTGALEIAFPVTATGSVMPHVEVEIHQYIGNIAQRVVIKASTYAQSSGNFSNSRASVDIEGGHYNAASNVYLRPKVRWYRSADKATLYLVIGDFTDTWQYPQVNVRRITNAYYGGDISPSPTYNWITTEAAGTTQSTALLSTPDGTVLLTGTPEGNVAATVGTRAIDQNATSGAVEWIKASGTGTTGWKVVYGDTGSRTVTSSLTAGAAVGSGGAVVIRRMGDTVHLMFNMIKSADATTTGRNALVIPSGFRPVSAVYSRSYQNVNAYAASSDVYFGSLFANAGTPADYITFTYLTSEAWPTTLPGTA